MRLVNTARNLINIARDPFRPKWEHSDSIIRYITVEGLTDPNILEGIVIGYKKDKDANVRRAAVKNKNLTNQAVLAEVALNDECEYVREAAVKKLIDPDVLESIVIGDKKDKNANVRRAAVENENLTNQAVLAEVALNDESEYVREAAAERLSDLYVSEKKSYPQKFKLSLLKH